jgi:anaerobic ribonucleoside-triphosphate reductase activating protein
MNYVQMRPYDIANGVGVRATLFVAGCTHHCKGCFNSEYKSFTCGDKWDALAKERFLSFATSPYVQGVTILGGEPLDQLNDADLLELVKTLKEDLGCNIWIYSGYVFEDILNDPKKVAILSYCDVLVDGPFILEQKDVRLKFRGSKNQRILDVVKSLEENQAIWFNC